MTEKIALIEQIQSIIKINKEGYDYASGRTVGILETVCVLLQEGMQVPSSLLQFVQNELDNNNL